ncbi:DinB family protein [Dendronalium sp. ChiSLP03b]|uniref:DinB family protein n=1 Tax=Dendronalium sp. ChiSLP03b TaxID=3075381 RepID=UPI002AD4ABCB|nr:DinB family protein [Dendronalium sp. ChiSLP03b]MDZ8207624.1 DinB family protein [Dendronalium sp. ChiSLP03b]
MNDAIAKHFQIMARNNRWSNFRLLNACAKLNQTELEAKRTSFFPSILLTLNHILIIDWYNLDALEGGNLGLSVFKDTTPYRTVIELQQAQAAADRRLIQLCDRLTSEGIIEKIAFDRVQQGIKRDRIDRTLAHLFVHQIHHRGQVHAMLSKTTVEPPQLDEFLMEGNAPNRAENLILLGFSEADITP